MRSVALLLLAASITVVDQLTKWYVWTHFRLNESRPALGTIFSWTYCHNRGGAFSILSGNRAFFLLAGTVISIYLAWSIPKISRSQPITALCYALILGGAIGNLIDRSLYGYVVDFVDFHWWPVFNFADSAITVGITTLAVLMLFSSEHRPTTPVPTEQPAHNL